MGGVPSTFLMANAYVHKCGGKSRSSKRSMTFLDLLLQTKSETSRVKKAHYDSKVAFAEEHTMDDCMTILSHMPIFRAQYALTAENLISGKD